MTLMRRLCVASTTVRLHLDVMCLLGIYLIKQNIIALNLLKAKLARWGEVCVCGGGGGGRPRINT